MFVFFRKPIISWSSKSNCKHIIYTSHAHDDHNNNMMHIYGNINYPDVSKLVVYTHKDKQREV